MIFSLKYKTCRTLGMCRLEKKRKAMYISHGQGRILRQNHQNNIYYYWKCLRSQ